MNAVFIWFVVGISVLLMLLGVLVVLTVYRTSGLNHLN